jgi:hypothetical protein
MKSSQTISHIKCLYKTNVSRTISVPIIRVLMILSCILSLSLSLPLTPTSPHSTEEKREEEPLVIQLIAHKIPDNGDQDGPQNVSFIQILDAADSPRGLH